MFVISAFLLSAMFALGLIGHHQQNLLKKFTYFKNDFLFINGVLIHYVPYLNVGPIWSIIDMHIAGNFWQKSLGFYV